MTKILTYTRMIRFRCMVKYAVKVVAKPLVEKREPT